MAMVILVGRVNSAFMTEVPASGGTITEGIIGTPTLVNPVLALSDAGREGSYLYCIQWFDAKNSRRNIYSRSSRIIHSIGRMA